VVAILVRKEPRPIGIDSFLGTIQRPKWKAVIETGYKREAGQSAPNKSIFPGHGTEGSHRTDPRSLSVGWIESLGKKQNIQESLKAAMWLGSRGKGLYSEDL